MPAAVSVRCHIVGAVLTPGVYTLPSNARIQDAIAAAGGPALDADLEQLNLAAAVLDQQQIIVPTRASSPRASSQGRAVTNEDSLFVPRLVDINEADSKTLQTLPGIGPVLAERIIAYRDEHGPFASVEELASIKGIGPATLEQLRFLITAGP
jgi:competence protein ComEA